MSRSTSRNRFYLLGAFLLMQWCVSNGTPLPVSEEASSASSTVMPQIDSIDVKCGRSGMNVHVSFDQLFNGVIYSKGHFYEQECNYVHPQNAGEKNFSFLIPVSGCGTKGQLKEPTPDQEMFFENIVIIQNDPLIQEVWDVSKSLKCTWQHSFSKSVNTKPLIVEDPQMVKVAFDSRSFNTLMQIQKGKSPFSSPATGYISVGDDASLVIYVQDSKGDLDANVVSCEATSTKAKTSVELVDRNGCIVRPNLMTPFAKFRNPKDIQADLMIYSNFKAFRIGEDPDFKVTCQLEVCDGPCLEPCALGPYSQFEKQQRVKRETSNETVLIEKLKILIALEAKIIDKLNSTKEKEDKECVVMVSTYSYVDSFFCLMAWLFPFSAIIIFIFHAFQARVESYLAQITKLKAQLRQAGITPVVATPASRTTNQITQTAATSSSALPK